MAGPHAVLLKEGGRQVERKAEVDAQGVSTLLEARLTGMLRMRATQDGVERIHGFHRLGDYPPYVIAGLAAYPEHGKTPDDLIRCAD